MFDDLSVFYRGIMLGFMVAAPVGPVGLLCIRRTIQKGLAVGFASGFGAAFADALFGAMAAFGVAVVMEWVRVYTGYIQFFGGAFLLFVAWHTWHDKPRQPHPEEIERRYLHRFGKRGKHKGFASVLLAMTTSFLITLTNPATILGVLAVIATFGGLQGHGQASALVAGVFTGSSLWWLTLAGGVALVRGHFTEKRVATMNKIMGGVLSLVAVATIAIGGMRIYGIDLIPTPN